MICTPQPFKIFSTIDLVCIICFTVDYILRLSLVAFVPTRLSGILPFHWEDEEKTLALLKDREPLTEVHYTKWKKFYLYLLSFHSVVDLLCIVPFFISLSSNSQQLSFFRSFRLFRIIRLMKLNYKGALVVALLHRTISRSWEAIIILVFYLLVLVFICGALAYIVEKGTFVVNSDYPNGEFLRSSVDYSTLVVSPYNSIPTGIYWAVVTATTVGYGDLTPTSTLGRLLGCVLSVLGVLVLALPISILGNNFTIEYDEHMKKVKAFEKFKEIKARQIKNQIEKTLFKAPLVKVKSLAASINHPIKSLNLKFLSNSSINTTNYFTGNSSINNKNSSDITDSTFQTISIENDNVSSHTVGPLEEDGKTENEDKLVYKKVDDGNINSNISVEKSDRFDVNKIWFKPYSTKKVIQKVSKFLNSTSSKESKFNIQDIETLFPMETTDKSRTDYYYDNLVSNEVFEKEYLSDTESTQNNIAALEEFEELSEDDLSNLEKPDLVSLLKKSNYLLKNLMKKHNELKGKILRIVS